MKSLCVACLSFLLFFVGFSTASWAGGAGPFISFLDSSDLGSSTGVGAKFQIQLNPSIVFDASAAYHDDLNGTVEGAPVDLELFPIELGIMVIPPIQDRRLRPYFGVGATYFQMDVADGNPFSDDDVTADDEFGWYGAIGLDFEMSRNLSAFVEGRYRGVEGTLESNNFERFGDDNKTDLDLSGLGLNAGVLFRW